MKKYDVDELAKTANEIRKDIVKSLLEAGSGHSAGSLGLEDILTALYFSIMEHNSQEPDWAERDRLIVSNGHIAPALYATLAHAGYFPTKELLTLRKFESRLQGHPERGKLPGLESTSGPLGEGLAQAAGYAYAARMDNKRFRVFCITSDGEHNEGGHWEAVLFAAKYNLSNLTVFVDRNNIQIDGHTEDVMPLEPLQEKYRSFGWHVLHIDGHNFDEIIGAVNHARAVYEDPTVIIAHTISGKGVSFMENLPEWHGNAPTKSQAKKALSELRSLGGKIQGEHE
jgi:transketolase